MSQYYSTGKAKKAKKLEDFNAWLDKYYIDTTKKNKPKKTASKKGGGILNSIINNLPVELHAPGYNYLGPGTQYEERISGKLGKEKQIPINALDAAAMEHDQAYNTYMDVKNRTKADKVLRKKAEKIYKDPNNPVDERLFAAATDGIFALKHLVGGGNKRKKRDIEEELRQQYMYNNDTESEEEYE